MVVYDSSLVPEGRDGVLVGRAPRGIKTKYHTDQQTKTKALDDEHRGERGSYEH